MSFEAARITKIAILICDVLLVLEVLIYGNQNVKSSLRQRKQLTIFLAAETCFADRFAMVLAPREEKLQLSRQAS